MSTCYHTHKNAPEGWSKEEVVALVERCIMHAWCEAWAARNFRKAMHGLRACNAAVQLSRPAGEASSRRVRECLEILEPAEYDSFHLEHTRVSGPFNFLSYSFDNDLMYGLSIQHPGEYVCFPNSCCLSEDARDATRHFVWLGETQDLLAQAGQSVSSCSKPPMKYFSMDRDEFWAKYKGKALPFRTEAFQDFVYYRIMEIREELLHWVPGDGEFIWPNDVCVLKDYTSGGDSDDITSAYTPLRRPVTDYEAAMAHEWPTGCAGLQD